MGIAAGNVHFTYAQLEGIWCKAGGNPQAAAMAAAIATAESGGNSAAYDLDSNGTIDRGLWQINSVHGAQSSFDIPTNARAAIAISNNGTNWSPWVTYNTGAYRQYLQSGVQADTNVPVNGTAAAANNSSDGTTTTQQSTTAELTSWQGTAANLLDPLHVFRDVFGLPNDVAGYIDNSVAKGIEGAIYPLLDPVITLIVGVLGMTAGGIIVIMGIFVMVSQSRTAGGVAGDAARAGLMAVAPEATSTTKYLSGAPGAERETLVTQTRRPGVSFRGAQLRQPVVRTTSQVLRDEANQYNNRSGGAQ